MLLQEQCQLVALTEDCDLLSRSGYVVQTGDEPDRLWWSLSHLNEKLLSKGENRTLYRWVCFVKQSVEQTALLQDQAVDKWLHTRSNDLPDRALRDHAATSTGIIAFLMFFLRDGRTPSLRSHFRSWLPQICSKAMSCVTDTAEMSLEGMVTVQVLPGGLVEGIVQALSYRHSMVLQTWQTEWALMREAGELHSDLDEMDRVLLVDLLIFCCLVDRRRRAAGKHVWPRQSPTGSTLFSVQKGLLFFLARNLDMHVLQSYVREHDCSAAIPSRRRLKSGSEAKRVQMNPDTIYELVHAAKESGLSAREALTFLSNSTRLSATAGCHPNVIDAWMWRFQIIYDQRAVVSMASATHLNLVSDASKHSGKEVLVTVAWSWENQTAAMCNAQVILPMDSLAPSELDLTSLVEKMAQAIPLLKTNNVVWWLL